MVELLQTVETLIRRRVLRRLIWVCTVCQIPSPDYNGLSEMHILSKLFCLPAKKGALLEMKKNFALFPSTPSLTTERDRETETKTETENGRDRDRKRKKERGKRGEKEKWRKRKREREKERERERQ